MKKVGSSAQASSKQFLSTSLIDDPEKSFHMNIDMQCFDTPDRPSIKPTNPDGTVSKLQQHICPPASQKVLQAVHQNLNIDTKTKKYAWYNNVP